MLGRAPIDPASGGPSAWFIAGIVVVVCAAVGIGLWLWRRWADHLRIRNFGEVAAGRLYRSGRLTPRTLAIAARKHGVRTVIDLGAYPPGSPEEEALARAAAELGLVRHVVRGLYGDGAGNANAYVHALRVMREESGRPVLVHCAAGAERTGAAVMLYRHHVEGVALEEAFAEALEFRHRPERNGKMRAFVFAHASAIGEAAQRGGWIEGFAPPDIRVSGGSGTP
jgi:protein tyrosine phosphatase (PTP) superfamily phosphohydrolase (DUF442 family)